MNPINVMKMAGMIIIIGRRENRNEINFLY
jgi:hypothetical protein